MKRRDFVRVASCGVAGAAFATSCTPRKNDSSLVVRTAETGSPPNVPDYHGFAQTSPGGGKTKSANDTVVLAVIGAGGFGTKLALDTANMEANVRFKYVCDVDDTRGGRAIAELEKKQGFKPIRVRDMRRVFDDKEVDAVFIVTPSTGTRSRRFGPARRERMCMSRNAFHTTSSRDNKWSGPR